MKNRIKKLVDTSIVSSEESIEIFSKKINLAKEDIALFKKSRNIIRKYHLLNSITKDDEKIIEAALALIPVNYLKNENATKSDKLTPLKEQILAVARRHEYSSDIYIDTNIPEKKYQNFKKNFNQNIEEDFLVLIDLTVFGSAKDALVVTVNGIYWHNFNEGFIPWDTLFIKPIFESAKNSTDITLGGQYDINVSFSSSTREEIIKFLKDLQTMNDYSTELNISSIIEIKLNNKSKDLLATPYKTLENILARIFLFHSPITYLLKDYLENSLLEEDFTDYNILHEKIINISRNDKLVNLLIHGEKDYISVFKVGMESTLLDLSSILKKDLGSLFFSNEHLLISFLKELEGYKKNILSQILKLDELSVELHENLKKIEENSGFLNNLIKTSKSSIEGAVVFGPVGLAIGVGSSFLNQSKKDKEHNNEYDRVLDEWLNTYEKLYSLDLQEYYDIYKEISFYISKLIINNYKATYIDALKNDKKNEFLFYVKTEIHDLMDEYPLHISSKETLNIEDIINDIQKT